MNTVKHKDHDTLSIAENYYQSMLQEDFDRMASYLNPNVHFIGPLAEVQGADSVVSAAKNLCKTLINIKIRSRFSSENQVMLAYDFIFPAPIGCLRAAVLMEFTHRLISKIELFFDSKPLEAISGEIFLEK
ncbi:MAG TPA: hypothetical protein DIU37_03925 [Opitutae bacterium]|nr:hypothetical protein [Opitutae bacterium]|tara:strand:- start:77 stop:469 length:393 start_codon:yes stop_codon:yes gene_type:complete